MFAPHRRRRLCASPDGMMPSWPSPFACLIADSMRTIGEDTDRATPIADAQDSSTGPFYNTESSGLRSRRSLALRISETSMMRAPAGRSSIADIRAVTICRRATRPSRRAVARVDGKRFMTQ